MRLWLMQQEKLFAGGTMFYFWIWAMKPDKKLSCWLPISGDIFSGHRLPLFSTSSSGRINTSLSNLLNQLFALKRVQMYERLFNKQIYLWLFFVINLLHIAICLNICILIVYLFFNFFKYIFNHYLNNLFYTKQYIK